MLQTKKLREILVKFHPQFAKNPDALLITIAEGGITHTYGNQTFTNKYVTMIDFMEYKGTIEAAIIPILHFLELHHPDIVLSAPPNEPVIDYKIVALDETTNHLQVSLNLSEMVRVNTDATFTIIPPPVPEPEYFPTLPNATLKDLVPAPFDTPDY